MRRCFLTSPPTPCAPRLLAPAEQSACLYSARTTCATDASVSCASRVARGAEIARFVGQRKLSLTADTHTHVLVDGREVDLGRLLAR